MAATQREVLISALRELQTGLRREVEDQAAKGAAGKKALPTAVANVVDYSQERLRFSVNRLLQSTAEDLSLDERSAVRACVKDISASTEIIKGVPAKPIYDVLTRGCETLATHLDVCCVEADATCFRYFHEVEEHLERFCGELAYFETVSPGELCLPAAPAPKGVVGAVGEVRKAAATIIKTGKAAAAAAKKGEGCSAEEIRAATEILEEKVSSAFFEHKTLECWWGRLKCQSDVEVICTQRGDLILGETLYSLTRAARSVGAIRQCAAGALERISVLWERGFTEVIILFQEAFARVEEKELCSMGPACQNVIAEFTDFKREGTALLAEIPPGRLSPMLASKGQIFVDKVARALIEFDRRLVLQSPSTISLFREAIARYRGVVGIVSSAIYLAAAQTAADSTSQLAEKFVVAARELEKKIPAGAKAPTIPFPTVFGSATNGGAAACVCPGGAVTVPTSRPGSIAQLINVANLAQKSIASAAAAVAPTNPELSLVLQNLNAQAQAASVPSSVALVPQGVKENLQNIVSASLNTVAAFKETHSNGSMRGVIDQAHAELAELSGVLATATFPETAL